MEINVIGSKRSCMCMSKLFAVQCRGPSVCAAFNPRVRAREPPAFCLIAGSL